MTGLCPRGLHSCLYLTCYVRPQLICTSRPLGTDTPATNMSITVVSSSFHLSLHTDADCQLVMNLSHAITEFSFGPYFPDITQPLDYSFETTINREFSSLFRSYYQTNILNQRLLRTNTFYMLSQQHTSPRAPRRYTRTSTA